LGLAIHENPRYSFAYPHEVPTRAVMTVEPGIYIPDWGGVRLEDLVVVQDDGFELLSHSPKEAVLKV
jgi:Xaa-Pro aminopeptidase